MKNNDRLCNRGHIKLEAHSSGAPRFEFDQMIASQGAYNANDAARPRC